VPSSTKSEILNVLAANGLLSDGSTFGAASEQAPGTFDKVNAKTDQLLILSKNTAPLVESNGPILIASSGGSNYIDISNYNSKKDQADTVIGGSGHDTIVGNGTADSLVAGSGHESIVSGGGLDTIKGGSGHDTLVGGGQSEIYGGSGKDDIKAGLFSGAHDTIHAGSGADKITLTQGNNTVYASDKGGSATITAGTGYDTIFGPKFGEGTDTINGGGHTTFNLGTGSVAFNLNPNSNDTIFGGAGTGFVNLNKASTDATLSATNINGQAATKITFASGGTITTVGTVNLTFTDTRKTS
jgi:flagellar hook assembly protein FlgD